MRINRVYLRQPLAGVQTVTADRATTHYIGRVLRMRAGADLVVFDGHGGQYSATLAQISRDTAEIVINEFDPGERESSLQIHLAQGVARGERMDLVLQKATELGVTRIVPLLTDHTVVQLDSKRASSRQQHWHKIVISACEQCGRNRLPEILAPITIDAWLANLQEKQNLRLMLKPGANTGFTDLDSRPDKVTVLIGPEGGLSPREHEIAASRGFIPLRLGPRVLRTETATLATLAVLQSFWGDAG